MVGARTNAARSSRATLDLEMTDPRPEPDMYDLAVIGTSSAAVALAVEASEAGLSSVLLVGASPEAEQIPPGITVFASTPDEIVDGEHEVQLVFSHETVSARAAASVDDTPPPTEIEISVPAGLEDRIHQPNPPIDAWDSDVLVVGRSEAAASVAVELSTSGSGVVLALGNADPGDLSAATRRTLLLREAERRLTVLWHSWPIDIENFGDFPMVTFDDVGTPDLLFDRVIFVQTDDGPTAPTSGLRMFTVGNHPDALSAGRAWSAIRSTCFPELEEPDATPRAWSPGDRAEADELRQNHYNAEITMFERAHSDLWVLRVRPDRGDVSHLAGQYASLGLGYWEPRVDSATDPGLEDKWEKLIRRSYSISSRVFDESGYLADVRGDEDLEFYVVLVPPSADRIPALTPRLALRAPGDRMYVGPRVAGRYTLTHVTDPAGAVLLLSTGTGEAPHNAMITELLRKGHTGPITSVVSVRYRSDLGYLDTHRRLEERFPNYRYLPLVTRDPELPKEYIQDVLAESTVAERIGFDLDPGTAHVYLCGNPLMIGVPEWEDEVPSFPEPVGACQILAELGFDLDRHRHTGNVHSEKYW